MDELSASQVQDLKNQDPALLLTEDSHPSPDADEIKKYVSVGTDNYNFSVHKRTFDTSLIVITIIFAILIITAVVVTLIFATKQSSIQAPTPKYLPPAPLTLQKNYGGVPHPKISAMNNFIGPMDGSELSTPKLCQESGYGRWVGDHCECDLTRYGTRCHQEKHHNSYVGVGNPSMDLIDINIIDTIDVSSKSFNQDSCSSQCDQREDCTGFLYDQSKQCTLIRGPIYIPRDYNIPYSHDVEPTLYVKNILSMHFDQTIFLSQYPHSFPLRPWLEPNNDTFARVYPGVITEIKFIPSIIAMGDRFTGIYCRSIFNKSDVSTILQRGSNNHVIIHNTGTELYLPPDWAYSPSIYVLYI